MRKVAIVGLTAAAAVAGATVAWAVFTANIVVPAINTGQGTGVQPSSCQTSQITFTVPDPTFSASAGEYQITTLDYSGIDTACINLGTADLNVNMVNGSTLLADGTASNMGAASGSITLSAPVEFDMAAQADYRFMVSNS